MDIDALLASQNPDDLRSLALKLLADLEQKTSVLEQQTQKNQTQEDIASTLRAALEQQTHKNQALTQYIQQLEEALKNARHWRFGRKSEAFQGVQRDLFDEDI